MCQITPQQFISKTGQPVTIRSAQETDAEALLRLARTITAEAEFLMVLPEELPKSAQEEEKWIIEHLNHPTKLLLAAEVNHQLIGILDFATGARQRIAHTGYFGISLLKQYYEQGIGSKLMQVFLEWAQAQPIIEKICLQVHAANSRARHVYQKLGFVEEGRQVRELKYGPDCYHDSILMGKWLR